MDPQREFCPNLDCPARGQVGLGTIGVHSQKERRYKCTVCGRTFAASRGTPFYRVHSPQGLLLVVLSLLSWGCPVQAVVHTFALDERTVAAWLQRTGQHCQQVHQHLVQQGQVDLQHVQADELWVKLVGQRAWQAMALAVPSRLWLGGVISPHRDTQLIMALVQHIRACATSLGILISVRGWLGHLRHGLPPGVPAPRPHRAPRPPALGGRARPADRAGGQTLRPAPGGEHQPAGRARDGRGDRGRAGRDSDRDGHPHRLYRAAQRDFPQPSDTPGPPRSRSRPH